jgi:hypothetical protein
MAGCRHSQLIVCFAEGRRRQHRRTLSLRVLACADEADGLVEEMRAG